MDLALQAQVNSVQCVCPDELDTCVVPSWPPLGRIPNAKGIS